MTTPAPTPTAAELLRKVQSAYASDASQSTFNALIYGVAGTGKTNILRTCPRPVLLHSFDPGGSKTVRDLVDEKTFFVDSSFEHEDRERPSAFDLWLKTVQELEKANVFDKLGTFCIDSFTTFSQALQNAVLRGVKRTAGTPLQLFGKTLLMPEIRDYQIITMQMRDIIKECAAKGCHFLLTAHETLDKDEATGSILSSMAATPSLRAMLPTVFDEVYRAEIERTSAGLNYRLLTRNTGVYLARTRIGNNGVFSIYEPQDIRSLLKRAGLPSDDKPPIE